MQVSVTLRRPVQLGESVGVLGEVTVLDSIDDGAIVEFALMENVGSAGKGGEGLVQSKFEDFNVKVAVVDDKLKRVGKGKINLDRCYRVRKIITVGSEPVLIVERFPTDFDYLMDLVKDPPDTEAIFNAARGPTTRPAKKQSSSKPTKLRA